MSFDPQKVTFFAKTDARGQGTPFGIKAQDRQRHMYVIGKTGMGKSTLLENMAVQDIQNGEGVAFIDPHGSTAEKLLDYIPEDRVDDVLYFAPFDLNHPISFNVMEDVGPDKRHLVVSGLMSVFEKIWVDAWSGRMAYILQNTLMALLEYPDSTLLGVNRMLSDKNYREKVVDNIKDPSVKSFWVDEFAKYNERYMQEAGDAIKNKIGQFTANPLIRNIIGQPRSTFDIRKIIDERKILIMNLSKGLVGETNANLLGSMLTTRIYLAAMSRADLPRAKMDAMPNFYFFVDEFQSFANATFSNILSEARKYKLNLTIAHQYIEQMEEEVKNAVFGNVGTIIAFRVGPFDAEELEKIFMPRFTASDICNLGFAQVYLSLMIDGIGSPPFSAVTLPPIEPPNVSRKDMVIASSRRQFARTRDEVEAEVIKFHEPVQKGNQSQGGSGNRGQQNKGGGSGPPGGGNKPSGRQSDRGAQSNKNTDRDRGRGGNGNERRERENTRPKERNVNELREVLAGISGNDDKGQNGQEKQDQQKKNEANSEKREERPEAQKDSHAQQQGRRDAKQNQTQKKDDTPDRRAELKSLIEGVVSERAGGSTQDAKPKPQKQQTEQPQKESGAQSGAREQEQGASKKPAPKTQQEANSDVSAKELERMMRVTTSDRPPLK